jgi:hypothetical protein
MSSPTPPDLHDPDAWCPLSFDERRAALAHALLDALGDAPGVREVAVEAGTVGREYDLTALVETDVGRLRTPLWSHTRAVIFCDASVHPANRRQLAPALAVREAADRLRRRLAARFTLESRGLTVTLSPEDGVTRTWTAERSLFLNRTAVTREDHVHRPAPDLDVRDLLAHFYTGPSLRLVGEDGTAFLLPARSEVEGPLVTLCRACGHWSDGAHGSCPHCGGPAEVVVAARPSPSLREGG